MSKSKVAILLATYNSEFYLTELIDSLLAQLNRNWSLFVRDDGSNDNTITIITAYSKQFDNIFLLEDDEQGRGAAGSFMWLLKNVESEYYMFCDHDDVWLPEKVGKSLNKIKKVETQYKHKPVLIHTDLIVVDETLKQISPSFWKLSNLSPKFKSFDYYCAYNNVTGCTIIINNLAKLAALKGGEEKAPMHDAWLALTVSFAEGIIDYIPEGLILYRQHHRNTIGAQSAPSIFSRLMEFKKVLKSNQQLFNAVKQLKQVSYFKLIINKLFYKAKIIGGFDDLKK